MHAWQSLLMYAHHMRTGLKGAAGRHHWQEMEPRCAAVEEGQGEDQQQRPGATGGLLAGAGRRARKNVIFFVQQRPRQF